MLYCVKCKVKIRTQHTRCPLCHGELHTDEVVMEEVYPKLPKVNSKYDLIQRVVTFAALVCIILSVAINWVFTPQLNWGVYVVIATLCSWLVIKVGIKKRRNLMKNTVWQLVILEAIVIGLDLYLGWEKWSVNYFLPLGILLALATLIFITIFLRLTSPEYMIYFLTVCMFGCVPIILLVLHVVTVKTPSVLCGCISLLMLSAFIVFQRKALVNEVSKKFHI